MSLTLTTTQLKTLSDVGLEELVLLYISDSYHPRLPPQRYGRSGQAQQGVDVYAHTESHGHLGYQAKAYARTTLTQKLFDEELAKAHDFEPKLDFYTVVTLNERNGKLQAHARKSMLHGVANRVQVMALEDLASIVQSSIPLSTHLIEQTFSAQQLAIVQELAARIVRAPTLVSVELVDDSLPRDLRDADDWVSNGNPLKAIALLDARTDVSLRGAATRIRCRALYSLGRSADVLALAQRERTEPSPQAHTLMMGALAAQELGQTDVASSLAQEALTATSPATRADTVGSYLRLLVAQDPDVAMRDMEAKAGELIGDVNKVAVALGDVAVISGDAKRAMHWYEIASSSRPNLSAGIVINILAARRAIATEDENRTELTRLIEELRTFAIRYASAESPGFKRAILINLGGALRACGRYVEAADAWDQVLACDGDQREMWIHRCLLGHGHPEVPAPSAEQAGKHVVDVLTKLVYASALTAAGSLDQAQRLVDDVLAAPQADARERTLAVVEGLLIRLQQEERSVVVLDALRQLSALDDPNGLLGWLAEQHEDVDLELRIKIDDVLYAADLSNMTDEDVMGIASRVAMGTSSAVALVNWIPRIKQIALDGEGGVANERAARVLAEVQADSTDFAGCIETCAKVLALAPGKRRSLSRLAKAHYTAGHRSEALEFLFRAATAPDATPATVLLWAQTAATIGKRREAKKQFLAMQLPVVLEPNDAIVMMQVRVLLGIRESNADAIAVMKSGALTPDRINRLVGLTLARKTGPRSVSVAPGTFVRLQIAGMAEETYYLGDHEQTLLPGVHTLDPSTHPWLTDLLERRVGDTVTLTQGNFAGEVASILAVHEPSDFLYYEAFKQLHLTSDSQTGIRQISGDTAVLKAQATELLASRKESFAKQVGDGQLANLPIRHFADLNSTTPRVLFQKQGPWTPRAMGGATEEIVADAAAADRAAGWLLDPVAVMLLVSIGASELIQRLQRVPRITRAAIGQLSDWRAIERRELRVTAQMTLTDDGQLAMYSRSAKDRVANLEFWRTVESIISQCRIIEVPTVPLTMESIALVRLLGVNAVTDYNACKAHGLTLVSEELSVRALGQHSSGISCTTLHRLILDATERNSLRMAPAMQWISRLIELGWTWVDFPRSWLWQCMAVLGGEAPEVLTVLTQRIRIATPDSAIKAVLETLLKLDVERFSPVGREVLRQAAVGCLPELDPVQRRKFRSDYERRVAASAGRSRTLKLLGDWGTEDEKSPTLR